MAKRVPHRHIGESIFDDLGDLQEIKTALLRQLLDNIYLINNSEKVVNERVNITDLPVTFADNYAFKALNLEKKPAILLGMDAMSLFDRVMIDFTNRRVGFDMPRGAVARNPVRLAFAN